MKLALSFGELLLIKKLTLHAFATILIVGLGACASSEDETDLEDGEPVEATDEETETTAAAPALPPAPPPAPPPAKYNPPMPAAPSTVAPSAVAATSGNGNITMRVMYVKSNGVKLYEKPDESSKVVGKVNKGDHFLVEVTGDWARTAQGGFVLAAALSEKGIGRGKRTAVWKSPNGRSSSKASNRKAKSKAPVQDSATPSPEAADASAADVEALTPEN